LVPSLLVEIDFTVEFQNDFMREHIIACKIEEVVEETLLLVPLKVTLGREPFDIPFGGLFLDLGLVHTHDLV